MTKEKLLKHLMSAIPADYDWEEDSHDSLADALLWWWCDLQAESLRELNRRELTEVCKHGLPAETLDSMLEQIAEEMSEDSESEDMQLPWLDEFYLEEITEFFEQGPKKL